MEDLTQQISTQRIEAKAELQKADLFLPRRPRYDVPRLPLNLTDLDDHSLMNLLVKFTRYQDHISGQLAEAEIDESAAESILEVSKARSLARGWTGATEDRVAVKKAVATTDPEVRQCADELSKLKARRKLLSIMVDSFARDAAVVSREITRRTGSAGVTRRVDSATP